MGFLATNTLLSIGPIYGKLLADPSSIKDKELLKWQMKVGSIVRDHESGRGRSGWDLSQISMLSEINNKLLTEIEKRSLTPMKRSFLWGWNN